jgi:hypothetical protein
MGAHRGRDNKASSESLSSSASEAPAPLGASAEYEQGPREGAIRKSHAGARHRQLIADRFGRKRLSRPDVTICRRVNGFLRSGVPGQCAMIVTSSFFMHRGLDEPAKEPLLRPALAWRVGSSCYLA